MGRLFLDAVRMLNEVTPSPQATAAGKVQRVTKLSDELEKVHDWPCCSTEYL